MTIRRRVITSDETETTSNFPRERTRANQLIFSSRSATALLEVAHRTSPVRNNLARPSSDHTPLGGLAVCARVASRARSKSNCRAGS